MEYLAAVMFVVGYSLGATLALIAALHIERWYT